MTSLRKQLADALGPVLPARKYRVLTSLGALDKIAKPTIVISQTEIEAAPAARGAAMVTMEVTVVTHREGGTSEAEDAIDVLGVEVFEALASLNWAKPLFARKDTYRESNLCYIITTQILTKRSTP